MHEFIEVHARFRPNAEIAVVVKLQIRLAGIASSHRFLGVNVSTTLAAFLRVKIAVLSLAILFALTATASHAQATIGKATSVRPQPRGPGLKVSDEFTVPL